VTLSERDRKLLMLIVPLVVLAGYWFLILGPKRDEAAQASDTLTQQEARLATAKQAADSAKGAENAFQSDFTEVVRLGKAIPASVDMPSLLVQLDAAAAGTGIRFTKIATGDRVPGATTTPAQTTTPPAGSESGTTGTPAAAGGETAQSQPGAAAEAANNTQQTANQGTAAAEQSGVQPSDTQTSTPAGATTENGDAAATAPPGLETVPLELTFEGNFFNLADFFHDVKRFVSVTNSNVLVSGRLLTVESVRWASDETIFPHIRAEITATVYLSPKTQGVTAGASPEGPATGTPASGTTPADSTPAVAPTATATR
jgi:hypothetical protein